eukprot:CAMPEP_0175258140 /NCGR_PEP_ID=MMETSP0093-20121207/39074_1 /TAXON_ID=311494 /ORGANISM="Alexandrium monilatum, Strain CCMP3105" /LENGTH=113 /DNA_ID=CAMNT_0016552525 /DNA_START=69 /DNA_END=407 /DNA_ORIENTATION=+
MALGWKQSMASAEVGCVGDGLASPRRLLEHSKVRPLQVEVAREPSQSAVELRHSGVQRLQLAWPGGELPEGSLSMQAALVQHPAPDAEEAAPRMALARLGHGGEAEQRHELHD